jgi:hypothetical protein
MILAVFPFRHGIGVFGVVELSVALHAIKLLLVASFAIVLDHILPCFQDMNDLPFISQGKDGGVSQPIFRFKKILVEDVVMRHVTVVTIGHPAVRAVAPGGELRRHDVAVHAGGRVIRQVGPSPGSTEDEQASAYDHSQEDDYRQLPLWGWDKVFSDFSGHTA